MSKETAKHIEAVRQQMRSVGVDAVIIPGTDPHQSEYISDYWKVRDWVSGFTGSNGTAVITLNEAALWTDSRYFLQAAEQLEGSGMVMHRENGPNPDTKEEWNKRYGHYEIIERPKFVNDYGRTYKGRIKIKNIEIQK